VPLQLLASGGDSSVVRRGGEVRGTRPGDGDHPGPVRNLLLLEAVRVALTIPPLVLMSNRFVDASRESDPLEELERERDLALLRATPLLGVAQLDETVSIVAGEADAAEIAQQGGEGERLDVDVVQLELPADRDRQQPGQAASGMEGRVAVLQQTDEQVAQPDRVGVHEGGAPRAAVAATYVRRRGSRLLL